MRILIDVDDVINNLCDAHINYLNKVHNLNVSKLAMEKRDIHKLFDTLSKEQVDVPLFTHQFWDTVELQKDASRILRDLINDGHEVYLCTSTYYKTMVPKFNRMFDLLKDTGITWNNVIVTANKSVVEADMIIDDYLENIKNSKCRYKIVFAQPYNVLDEEDCRDCLFVSSWNDIYNIILGIQCANNTRYLERRWFHTV